MTDKKRIKDAISRCLTMINQFITIVENQINYSLIQSEQEVDNLEVLIMGLTQAFKQYIQS